MILSGLVTLTGAAGVLDAPSKQLIKMASQPIQITSADTVRIIQKLTYSWFQNIWKISIFLGSSRRRPQWTKCYGNRLFITNTHASWWKAYFRGILFIQVVYGMIHGKSRCFKYYEINCIVAFYDLRKRSNAP